MERDQTSYLVLHYLVLIAVIIAVLSALEVAGHQAPFWFGLSLAIATGFLYPRIVRSVGVAPKGWE